MAYICKNERTDQKIPFILSGWYQPASELDQVPEMQAEVSDRFQTLGSKIKLIQQIEIIFWKEVGLFFFPLSPILYLS